jgi:hypothetical protein
MNIYTQLTKEFNTDRLRTVICSGQAAVLHRLTIMSKDGDWILREDEEAILHVIQILESHNARYRFGAPLDLRWLKNGWSSHFEFFVDDLRVRTDFFTRPPRLKSEDLDRIWLEQVGKDVPFISLRDLAEIKKTMRDKDYPIIGQIAKIMPMIREQILYSRSAHQLEQLKIDFPELVEQLIPERPLLSTIKSGTAVLKEELDRERRTLEDADAIRLKAYTVASLKWKSAWIDLEKTVKDLPLTKAHEIIVQEASAVLPFSPSDTL